MDTWVMAMGQAFFLSLNHRLRHDRLRGVFGERGGYPRASLRTALFDTLAALLSGLAIMPAVFAYGVDVTRGPSLMFDCAADGVPKDAVRQGFCRVLFYFGGIRGDYRAINMFEAVTESWQSHFGLGRKTAVLICSAITLAAGLFLEAEPRVGSWLDFITIVVVPIGGSSGRGFDLLCAGLG